jgi:hypothetical protein
MEEFSLIDKVKEEGEESDIGLPLVLFKEDFIIPSISVHEAIEEAMGSDWEFKDMITFMVSEKLEVISESMMNKYEMTENECGAIIYYTCDARRLAGKVEDNPYKRLNELLAKRNMTIVENWKPYIYFLLCALNKIPNSDEPLVVYRALDIPITQLSKRYQNGKKVVWISFTSTSLDRNAIDDFINNTDTKGTFMLLKVIEGKDISEFSIFENEKEVLLLPNSKFIINEKVSDEAKCLMNIPPNIDGIIMTQQRTPPQLLL